MSKGSFSVSPPLLSFLSPCRNYIRSLWFIQPFLNSVHAVSFMHIHAHCTFVCVFGVSQRKMAVWMLLAG